MLSPPKANKVEYTPIERIQQKFNKSQYPRMIVDGLLKPEYLRNDHLKEPEKRGKPKCTHSQMIRYYDKSGHWLVEVHQYWHQDKTIKGTRRPDPKRLRIRNKVFIVEAQRQS
jgi:hypothetical protein